MNKNQENIKDFMLAAGQDCPSKITIPDSHTRILRVRLLLEEVLELAEASAIQISIITNLHGESKIEFFIKDTDNLKFSDIGEDKVDITEVADAIGDINYVNYGAANSYGIDMENIDTLVHKTNLAKFGEGGYRDDNGKWRKPPNWQAPDIAAEIEKQK